MISKAHFHTRACLLAAACLVAGLALAFAGPPAQAQTTRPPVDYIELIGFIDKPTAGFLIDQIHKAEASGSSALLVRIDSPGGLAAPVERLIRRIRSARVPVVAWIGPSDAEGGSAAAYIASAAHVTAVAPRATFGPVLPSDLAAGDDESRGDRGIFQNLVTFRPGSRKIVSYNASAESRAISGARAKQLGLADEAVSNLPALLNELDGRKVYVQGKPVILPRQPFTLRFHKMALGPRLLHSALRPSIAYVLIIIGVFGFIFELYHPGIGAAAVSGALSLGFGLYAMTVLPANWWAVMLLIASLGLFLIELHRSSLGRYSLAGTAAFFVATFNLFSGPDQVFDLKWWVVAEAVAMIALFYFFIMPAAFRSQLTPAPDVKPLLGMAAVAETDVSPMGKVNAGGSTWDARTFGAAIPEGADVVVKGASGSVLIVEESKGG